MATQSTIRSDVPDGTTIGPLTEDGAAELLKKRWLDAAGPSKDATSGEPKAQPETEAPEAVEEVEEQDQEGQDPEDRADDDTEEKTESEPKADKVADDDALVTVKIDGEEKRVSVKDLKRLYGQEASLTKKSQELAAVRKQAEELASRYDVALQEMLQRAEARWRPYAELDFLVLSKSLSAEDLAQLRKDAQEAYNDVRFLREGISSRQQELSAKQQQELFLKAKEAVKQITDKDNPNYIPDWSDDLYNSIRSYAVQQGFDQTEIDTEVDPKAIKTLWKAMQFDKLQDEAKKVTTKKTPTTPKRVVAPGSGNDAPAPDAAKKALNRLKQSGNVDDFAAVMKARWAAAR